MTQRELPFDGPAPTKRPDRSIVRAAEVTQGRRFDCRRKLDPRRHWTWQPPTDAEIAAVEAILAREAQA